MALAADRRRLHRRRLAVRPARGARAPGRLAPPWLLLLIFSSVSVAGNVAHGAPTPVGRLVAAVPPIALVLAFDLLMRQLQEGLKDSNAAEAPAPERQEASPPALASVSPARARSNHSVQGERLVARPRAEGQPVTGRWLSEQLAVSDAYARRLLRRLDGTPSQRREANTSASA